MTRVVVVGNGMTGARVADELAAKDRRGRLRVTVLGAETVPAYNRVLLSDVLAGKRRRAEIDLPTGDGVARRLGAVVTRVDREARLVHVADGEPEPYDHLVLATGSTPFVPPVHGIADGDGRLRPGVYAFRTLDDCDSVLADAGRAARAVVVGGGLLGVEAARGLLARGLRVTLLHVGTHLLDTQLDAPAGRLLQRSLEELGIAVVCGARVTAVTGGRRVTGVALGGAEPVPAELVVLACGVRPAVDLARAAGLDVGRGILVDDWLRTSDRRISAIGDCAEHAGRVYGLVQPGWEQAAVLADVLTGSSLAARYTGSRLVARLKAADLEVASMGEHAPGPDDEEAGLEVLQFRDGARRTYKKVVLRDGRVTGAVLVGDVSTAAVLSQAFDGSVPLPADRLSLLFAGVGGGAVAAADPAELPDAALVCTCNGVTAGRLRTCGARTPAEAAVATRATTGCGGCTSSVAAVLAALEPDAPLRSTA